VRTRFRQLFRNDCLDSRCRIATGRRAPAAVTR